MSPISYNVVFYKHNNFSLSLWIPKTGKALAIGVGSLTLEGGGTIEDLDIDFTLPGYPDIELRVSNYKSRKVN